MAVQQWQMIIALNYKAKGLGVKRLMSVLEAMLICPELILVHVGTISLDPESGTEEYIPSSITTLGFTEEGDSMVELRNRESEQICLKHYEEESQKIFSIVRRFSDIVEHTSPDEAFVNVSRQV